MTTRFRPDAVVVGGVLQRGVSLLISDDGVVLPSDANVRDVVDVPMPGRLVVPGFVNGHSHAFQRVLRGRTEFLAKGHERDDFWSWREAMYAAATALSPEQLYDVSRQCFLEMALAGVTTVGEFHYVHHQPDGTPYDDVQLLARQVIAAARDVGLRIVLLRVGYARAGFGLAPNPRQKRFIEPDVETYLARTNELAQLTRHDPLVTVGLAPHSVRAVPRSWLSTIAREWTQGPLHMHVSEQPAELRACEAEYGMTPVKLLESEGLLSERFTAVHAIHLHDAEVAALGAAKSVVCACPSTERNLGDGIVKADELLAAGAHVSLGTDSHAHIGLLEEAQMLEGHLRLLRLRRNVLDPGQGAPDGVAARLLTSLTLAGDRSLGLSPCTLAPGSRADFVSLDLQHPTVLGVNDTRVLMGAPSSAVRDVVVGGRTIVRDGRHAAQAEVAKRFEAVMHTLV
ncbi:MAG: formimidoylglutamate deiminase [Archangium sp.]